MFCEHCGAKNELDAKFCVGCGAAITSQEEPKKEEKKAEKKEEPKTPKKKMSKKMKVAIVAIVVILVALAITLSILLNNPTKKVEDNLTTYYETYDEDSDNSKLKEINKILKSKENNDKALESIEKQAEKTMNNWVYNFNKPYKNTEALSKEYKKLRNVLEEIYDYFDEKDNGEYILDEEQYDKYIDKLEELYESKNYYLRALEYPENNYQRYYYAQKVVEEDSYYQEAQETIKKFISSELESLQKKVNEKLTVKEDSTEEEKYKNYADIVQLIEQNKVNNNLDLSSSEEYKNLLNDYSNKLVESIKKYTESLINDGKVKEAITILNNVMYKLNSNNETYKTLSKLKEEYNDKLPTVLTTKYQPETSKGYISTSKWSSTINGVSYEGYVAHRFTGKSSSIVYRLNKDYKKFRGKIVIGKDWDKDFKVSVVIKGDDKELYRLDNITKETKIEKDIDIDITGVDDIKIEFISSNGSTSYSSGSRYLYIVEPYLYK